MATQLKENLEGLLRIADKHKQINQFIQASTEVEVESVLSVFSGQDLQSQSVRLLLADKFRRVDIAIELLRHADKTIVARAVKLPWLFEPNDNCVFLDSKFLMNDFFPSVSYSCRLKVINHFGQILAKGNKNQRVEDVEKLGGKVDKIFEAIERKYGFYSAIPLLPACSKEKLNAVISSRNVSMLKERLVVAILKKYPDIGLTILKKNFSKTTYNHECPSYTSALRYLFDNHPEKFIELFVETCGEEFNPFAITLGRRRSKKMIQLQQDHHKELLKSHGEILIEILCFYRIRQQYNQEEFELLFQSVLPKSVNQFTDAGNIDKWLKRWPESERLEILLKAFQKKYEMNLLEHPEFTNPFIVGLLPQNSEDRLRIVEWKMEKDRTYYWKYGPFDMSYVSDQDRKLAWHALKPIDKSLPELKQLYLTEQDVNRRATLAQVLILTCFANKSPESLTDVLNLLTKRSRNDQYEHRYKIFSAIDGIMDEMELSKEQWDLVLEMIQVSQLYKETMNHGQSQKPEILQKCLSFHLKSNLPIETIVGMIIKLKVQMISRYYHWSWKIENISREDEKKLIFLYVKELESVLSKINSSLFPSSTSDDSDDDSGVEECILSLVRYICDFNEEGKKLKDPGAISIPISSLPWLKTQFDKLIKIATEEKEGKSRYMTDVIDILQRLNKANNDPSYSPTELERSFYLKSLKSSPSETALIYFLHQNPKTLDEDWSSILSYLLKTKSKPLLFIERIRNMNYRPFAAKTIEECHRIMEVAEIPSHAENEENEQDVEDSNEDYDDDDDNEEFNDEPTSNHSIILQKCNAITYLSILSEPSDYLKSVVSKFYPVETKVDVFAKNSEEDYQIKESIAKSLINISIPHLSLEAIEKFCVGDYLKLTIGSLYSQCSFVSETTVLNFLRNQLETNSRVSLKKHLIRLFFKISSIEDKQLMLQSQDPTDSSNNNITIRYEIFLQTSHLFRVSPSQQTWALLKSNIEKITPEDVQALSFLSNVIMFKNCPTEFLSSYVQVALATLRKGEDKSRDNFMTPFINQVEQVVGKLDQAVLDDIILYKSSQGIPYPTLYTSYLSESDSPKVLAHRIQIIKSLVREAIGTKWDETSSESTQYNSSPQYPTRRNMYTLVVDLCKKKMDGKEKMKEQILSGIQQELEQTDVSKIFKEALFIQLAFRLLKESEKTGVEKLRSFGGSIGQITDEYVKKYGGEIISIVASIVRTFVDCCCSQELQDRDHIVELVSGLLNLSQSRHSQIISISLMLNVNPQNPRLKKISEEINLKIKSLNDVVAQIFNQFKEQ